MVTLHMHFNSVNKTKVRERVGCRCLLFKGDNVLLVHEEKTDTWMIPGGGLESGESLDACCAREMSEETGVVVSPGKLQLTINEYYDDVTYINHYFDAEYVRDTDVQLTELEKEVGTKPKWISVREAIEIFGKYETLIETDRMKAGLYHREHAALSYFDVSRKNWMK